MDPEAIKMYFKRGTEAFLPHISINCVVLTFESPNLKFLVQRLFKEDMWVLPGGHIYLEENLDDAAYRNLKLSGFNDLFLRQFKTFGDTGRLNMAHIPDPESFGISPEILKWVTQRFVTVGYYGLVNSRKIKLQPGLFSSESRWMEINNLDSLVLDHAEIVLEARKVLSEDLLSFPVAANLLPETFTMPELKTLYEAILSRTIDRGSFRRKILRSGIIEKVGKQSSALRRPADIYTLNHDKYIKSLLEETKLGF